MPATYPEETLRDRLVVLVGGGGFFGRHLAQELLERGARLRIIGRHVERAYTVRALANLGQVQFVHADITRTDKLATIMAGATAVVNLVGAFSGNLDAVQGSGAGRVAQAAREAGVSAFVHISAIGADAGSSIAYARTKAEGEQAVHAAFPNATVIRPSILFGPDDNFVIRFARLVALKVLPVFAPEAPLQPLFVDDAAEAVAHALVDPLAHGGKTYEIAGPEVLTMLDFTKRVAKAADREPRLMPLGDGLAGLLAALPLTPISTAQYKLLKAGNVASGTLPGLAELGVAPRPLGLFLDRWMLRFRDHGRFGVKQRPAV